MIVTNGGTYIADPTDDLTWLFQYIKLEVFLYPPGNVQRITGTIEHTMGEGEFEITLGESVVDSTISPTATQIAFDIQITPDSSQERIDLFSAKPVLDPSVRRPGSNMYPYAQQKWQSFAFYDADGNKIYGDSHANPIRGSGDQPFDRVLVFEGFSAQVDKVLQIAIGDFEIYPPRPVYQAPNGSYILFRDYSYITDETFLVLLRDGSEYQFTRRIEAFPHELVLSPESSAEQWEIYE
ncbi:hypothetical protein K8I31_00715 [bacterium]|nr:hypothetical protein [bacterium]